VKIGIADIRRIDAERKKDADKNGIGIKIIGIARCLFIVGNKILNCQLSETVPNAMVMIGMIGQIDDFRTMINVLLDRSEGERQSMIGWGGRLSVHDRLGERVGHFPRNQEELEEMANAWVPNEFIFCRDANIHRMESRVARYQPVRKTQLP